MNAVPTAERRRLLILALAGFSTALFAFAPAGLAAFAITRAAPLTSIAGAEGTIWRGRLLGVSYNGVALGDIDYRLHAPALALARASIDLKSAGGALEGIGNLRIEPRAVEFRDVSATFNLGAIRRYTFFGVRYQGAAKVTARRLRLTREGCEAEAAAISTSAFDAFSRQLSGEAFPMAGPVECRDGVFTVSLEGEGADGAAELNIAVRKDFSYSLTVAARPKSPDVSRALEFFGFENGGGALSYEAAGVLKGLSS